MRNIWLTTDRVNGAEPCWSYLEVEEYFGTRKKIALKAVLADEDIYNFDRIWLADKFLLRAQRNKLCAWFDAKFLATPLSMYYTAARNEKNLRSMVINAPIVAEVFTEFKQEVLAQIQEILK